MTDVFTAEKRSEIMSKIRGKWTGLEVRAHSILLEHGVPHEMHPGLPGNPDMLVMESRTAIFIDGCFWHGCPRHYREPKSNRAYWVPKIEQNMRRDRRSRRRARRAGYRTRRIWECRLTPERLLSAAGARGAQ